MKALTCQDARCRLQAFHDRELSVGEQVAVAKHLRSCGTCAAASAELATLALRLQMEVPGRGPLSNEEAAGFTSAVVTRLKAEEQASLVTTVRLMFVDMHLVYAALGATAATLTCAIVLLSMLRFGAADRPDSLAAMATFLATPGTGGNIGAIDAEVQMRWTERFRQANEAAEQDTVFALSAVVTQDGRHPTVGPLQATRHRSSGDAVLIKGLLDAVSRARLGPHLGDLKLASNMLWLVTETTVRAAKVQAIDLILPPAPKKRASVQAGRTQAPAAV